MPSSADVKPLRPKGRTCRQQAGYKRLLDPRGETDYTLYSHHSGICLGGKYVDNNDTHDPERQGDTSKLTLEELGPELDRISSNVGPAKEKCTQPGLGSPKKKRRKPLKQRSEFNPWRELDKASRKTMSRRQILRGVFRFLPEKKEE